MKSAGVVLLGFASGSFSLAHYNDIIGAVTVTGTCAIVLLKLYRSLRKTFGTVETKQQEPKEETETV